MSVFIRHLDPRNRSEPYNDESLAGYFCECDDYERITQSEIEPYDGRVGQDALSDIGICDPNKTESDERAIPFSFSKNGQIVKVSYPKTFPEEFETFNLEELKRRVRDPDARAEQKLERAHAAAAIHGAQEVLIRHFRQEPVALCKSRQAILKDDTDLIIREWAENRRLGRVSPYREMQALSLEKLDRNYVGRVARCTATPDEKTSQSSGWPALDFCVEVDFDGVSLGAKLAFGYAKAPKGKPEPFTLSRSGWIKTQNRSKRAQYWTNIYGIHLELDARFALWRSNFLETMGYRIHRCALMVVDEKGGSM